MADEPDTTGAGRRPGQDRASLAPAAEITAAGPDPPRENTTESPGTAAGDRPPWLLVRLVLTPTRRLSCRTRTGSAYSRSARVPPGSAVTVVVSVVRLGTATDRPDVRAAVTAACCARSAAVSCVPPTGARWLALRVAGNGRAWPVAAGRWAW